MFIPNIREILVAGAVITGALMLVAIQHYKSKSEELKTELAQAHQKLDTSNASVRELKALVDAQNASVEQLKKDADKAAAASKVALDKASANMRAAQQKAYVLAQRQVPMGMDVCTAADKLLTEYLYVK